MFKIIAENGRERQHRPHLRKLLETTTCPVRIASAYVTDTDLLLDVSNRPIRLLTSLWPPDIAFGATSLDSLRALVDAGVTCRCVSDGPKLHAKTDIFDSSTAVITSANLTRNALDANLEVGVQLTGGVVRELVSWFDSFWSNSRPLDLRKISKWEKETEVLRKRFAALRRKMLSKPGLPNEAVSSSRSPTRLRYQFSSADSCFVCNTNRRWSRTAEDSMYRMGFAAVWEDFNYPSHMEKVQRGDTILMFAKRVGIIGIGRAKGPCEILPVGSQEMVRHEHHAAEWRVPVHWLVWVENDADAYPCQIPNVSFIDISKVEYRSLRQGVKRHFLRDP